MEMQFDRVVKKDSDGFYVVSMPALTGCHRQARSLDALMGRIKIAIELGLEVEDDPTDRLDFVGVQRIRV